MKLTSVLFMLWLTVLLPTFSSRAADRPQSFDIELAYPVDIPRSFPRILLDTYRYEFMRRVTLQVDSDGNVDSIVSVSPADSVFETTYKDFLLNIVFMPGTREGVFVKQTLPILVRVNPETFYPKITFPVDSTKNIEDADLYFAALGDNGVVLPGIKSFPSYFFQQRLSDSLKTCAYVLVKLKLDGDGRPLAITPLTSGAGPFTDQILSAVNWGEYSVGTGPLGEPIHDDYLVISLVPGVAYPTILLVEPTDTLDILERVRVRLVADTLGLMQKPIPALAPPGSLYHIPSGETILRDTIGLRISIDTLGHARLLKVAKATREQRDAYEALVESLEFCPALDWSGHPRPFDGLLLGVSEGSMTIRIRFCWFDGECFSYFD